MSPPGWEFCRPGSLSTLAGGSCIYIAVWGESKEPGHSSARREACSKDEMVWWMSQAVALKDLSSPLFWDVWWARKGKWQIVKKYTCVESSKTVRLSYVLLDSWKFIFSLFYVFSKFSIMNMYFLNQKNKIF